MVRSGGLGLPRLEPGAHCLPRACSVSLNYGTALQCMALVDAEAVLGWFVLALSSMAGWQQLLQGLRLWAFPAPAT